MIETLSHTPETEPVGFEEKRVYVVPASDYLEVERDLAERNGQPYDKDCVLVAVNPFTGKFKDSPRFSEALSEDLEVEVEPMPMPLTLIDENGNKLNTITKIPEEAKIVDEMIDRERPGNIGGWYGYRITGEAKKLHSPLFAEYVGALVAREVGHTEDDVWLEDITRQEPGLVRLASEDFNLAEHITEEHDIGDLDRIITGEMERVLHKPELTRLQRIKHAIGEKASRYFGIQPPTMKTA